MTLALEPALDRARPLLVRGHRDAPADRGYADLLGVTAPRSTGPAQDLMLSRGLPVVYERLWRPVWGRLLTGIVGGSSTADARRIARLLLGLTPGDGVLDVACGPGNFTRDFGAVVGEGGLAVGVDASATMLDRAVRDTPADRHPAVAYVRGDAVRLPFRDASFDAVCCFAALHLFEDPWEALDHMVRVLTPGGRLALLTSCRLRWTPGVVGSLAGRPSGIRVFGQDEVTGALADRGLESIHQRVGGVAQFVGARKPPHA